MKITGISEQQVVLELDRRDLRILSSALNYLANGHRFTRGELEQLVGVTNLEMNRFLDERFLKIPETTQIIDVSLSFQELNILENSLKSFYDGRIVKEVALQTYVGGDKSELGELLEGLTTARKVSPK